MAFDEFGYICPYNERCRCQVADCDFCGWNPAVSERRLEEFCNSVGIKKERTMLRCIDAIDLAIKLRKSIEPMIRRECKPKTVYAVVMKCIAAAPTITMDAACCEEEDNNKEENT